MKSTILVIILYIFTKPMIVHAMEIQGVKQYYQKIMTEDQKPWEQLSENEQQDIINKYKQWLRVKGGSLPSRADISENWRSQGTTQSRIDIYKDKSSRYTPRSKADISENWRSQGTASIQKQHYPRMIEKKIIDVSGTAVGLPIIGNENVYLQTSGLISCTGLVITDNTNTLIAHVVSDKTFRDVTIACLKAILNKGNQPSNKQLKVRAYFSENQGAAQAAEIAKIAQEEFDIQDTKFEYVEGMLTINVFGDKVTSPNVQKTFFCTSYYALIDSLAKEQTKEIKENYVKLLEELDTEIDKYLDFLGSERMWVIKEYDQLEYEKLELESFDVTEQVRTKLDQEWEIYRQKLQSHGLTGAMYAYVNLRKKGVKLENQRLNEESTIRQTIKKDVPISEYLRKQMCIKDPWTVETLQ